MRLNQLLTLCGFVAGVSLCVTPAFAAGYAPLIEEGKVWQYAGQYSRDCNGCDEGGVVYHSMKFDGALTVNGKEYHRLTLFKSEFYKGTSEYGVLEYSDTEEKDETSCYMREDDGQVYILTLDDMLLRKSADFLDPTIPGERYGEILRYDFTLNDGDRTTFLVRTGELLPVIVRIKEPVMVNGSERKAMTYLYDMEEKGDDGDVATSLKTVYPGSVIEGVGPTEGGDLAVFGPPYTTGMPDNTGGPGQGSFLKCVTDSEGKVIYGSKLPVGNDDPHSILAPGKMWKWEFISYSGAPGNSTVTATVEDKQLYIDSRPARRVNVVSDAGLFSPFSVILSESDDTLDLYLADNENGTYARFLPLMDFFLEQGDVVCPEGEGAVLPIGKVVSVFTETVCGIDRRYQEIRDEDTGRTFVWVRGIGAQYTDEYLTRFPEADCGKSFGSMLECYEDGVCVFKAEDFTRGQDSVEGVYDYATGMTDAIYDLMGRRVDSPQPGTVYVRDGRKFVGK